MPRFGRPLRRTGPPLFPGRRRAFGPARPLAPGPIRALAQANRLLAEGQFAAAADQFELLANSARANRIPAAPRLFVQAARACWRAGQVPRGMQLLRNGLGILMTAGAVGVARQIASAAAGELETQGQAKEAEEVRKFISELPAADVPAEAAAGTAGTLPAEPARPTLPTHCGQCGAVLRPDEVEWIDEQTAECAYCNSPIRPEK